MCQCVLYISIGTCSCKGQGHCIISLRRLCQHAQWINSKIVHWYFIFSQLNNFPTQFFIWTMEYFNYQSIKLHVNCGNNLAHNSSSLQYEFTLARAVMYSENKTCYTHCLKIGSCTFWLVLELATQTFRLISTTHRGSRGFLHSSDTEQKNRTIYEQKWNTLFIWLYK